MFASGRILLTRAFLLATHLFLSPVWTSALPVATVASTTQRRLIQYVQTFHPANHPSEQLSLLPLAHKDLAVTHVILAALHVNAVPGDITLNDLDPASSLYQGVWSDVKVLQQRGIRVLVMMGGAARGSYAGRLCSSDGGDIDDTFYSPLVAFLYNYGLDGIDLDIEESVRLDCATALIQLLRNDMAPDFIVTMAPVASDLTPTMRGLSGFNYKELEESSAGALVDWYNTQYYSGFVEGSIEQSYAAAVKNGFSASRIVLGVLDSANDGFGHLTVDQLKSAVSNIQRLNANFGGLDAWEYFDSGSSDGFQRRTRWLKEIASVTSNETAAGLVASSNHWPPMSRAMLGLIDSGYSQIEAAIMLRRQRY